MKNTSLKKLVFIGAGKVATALSASLKGKAHIIQVYSKTLANAKKLGQKTAGSYTNNLKKIVPDADIYIIAVKDDAIEEVSKTLKLPGKIIIHTSGSTELKTLKNISKNIGVLWPMHSFTGKAGLLPKTPFFIEASNKKTEKELTVLVKQLKGIPYYIDSKKRAIVHMTAVFVNNFPNHLFTIAEAFCKKAGVPFKLFLPLADETINNIKKRSPALSQTGPASRNDKKIIYKHLLYIKIKP